jgi:phosphoribosylformylglycinamidine synthase
MALAGGLGAEIDPVWGDAATFLPAHAFLFGEDQARYVLAVPAKFVKDVEAAARKRTGVPLRRIGTVGGRALTLGSLGAISLDDMRARHESWLPDLMERD